MEEILKSGGFDDDRFDRSKRIDWMDIGAISSAKALVVGAGALGNEVVKNLILSGFGQIYLIDMDHIVTSNLNRCVFFRSEDSSKRLMKAEVVARRASELYPGCKITYWVGRVEDMPFNWNDFQIVLGCLDNVMTRLYVNSHCYYNQIPYVDGGTDGFRGKIQVVLPPNSPCLQCGMNNSHQRVLQKRFSCTGADTNFFIPKMAAEITTTSIIAALQVREALKIICKREDLCIKNLAYYDGIAGEIVNLELEIESGCQNHFD